MRKIKNGIILAGGDSSRFWPLEEKSFFTFLGKPLILYQTEQLSKYCENITIIASKSNAVMIKRLLDNVDQTAKYQVIIQKDISGQAGAILTAKNLVKGETLIINASDVIDYTILEKITKLPPQKNKIIYFGKKINEYFPGGYFKFDKNKIDSVVEKPDKDKLPSNIFKLVVDYYSDVDDLMKVISSTGSKVDNYYEVAINKLLSSSLDRELLIYEGYFLGLKYPWHLLEMLKLFLNKIKKTDISPLAKISKKSIIIGPVIIEDNVKIGDYVKITGPAYIGKNSIVGDYSLVRESQIAEDCLVGSYTEVARSYVGNNVFLHRNYIGDSVLSDDVMFGAQAVTANFRFDGESIGSYIGQEKIDTNLSKFGTIIGKNSRIGVNATIVPGIKIGKLCWIGPGETVKYDIEDKTYLSNGEERENLNV